MKRIILLILLNGIVHGLDAQNIFPQIGNCDSVAIDCIDPAIMTVVNLHEEDFEKYYDRQGVKEKRHVAIYDSIYIRELLDSVYNINPILSIDDIDVRGRLTIFSANSEEIVFYIGLCRLSYKGIVYQTSPFAFQLLYMLFGKDD